VGPNLCGLLRRGRERDLSLFEHKEEVMCALSEMAAADKPRKGASE